MRFPVADLVEWGRRNGDHVWNLNDAGASPFVDVPAVIRMRLGIGAKEWRNREAAGLTFWQADDMAVRAFNVPPWIIWPEWETARDGVDVDGLCVCGCGEPASTRGAARFASKRCRWRERERRRRAMRRAS